jgi:hypothetical protein
MTKRKRGLNFRAGMASMLAAVCLVGVGAALIPLEEPEREIPSHLPLARI